MTAPTDRPSDPTIRRMVAQTEEWLAAGDARSDFLRCYALMTGNMLQAVSDGLFQDSDWVSRLLHRFAEYYFNALKSFESEDQTTPLVWQHAHGATCGRPLSVLERLFVGINAHINYDLVLALVDLLDDQWEALDEVARRARYDDHCRVNDVIARTVDAVQDTVVEERMPELDLLDRGLGPLDEWVVSKLIEAWRQDVWENAVAMLEAPNPVTREALRRRVEEQSLRRAQRYTLNA